MSMVRRARPHTHRPKPNRAEGTESHNHPNAEQRCRIDDAMQCRRLSRVTQKKKEVVGDSHNAKTVLLKDKRLGEEDKNLTLT